MTSPAGDPIGPDTREDLRFRQLADALPSLVSSVDRHFVYRFVNLAYSEWFGTPRDEIVGRKMVDVLGEATMAVVKPRLEAAFAGETVSYEATLPYKHGGPRRVIAAYIPDRDAGGVVGGAFVHVTDITARYRAEQAERASATEFDTYFELPTAGKAQSDATGRLIRVNAKMCEITGYSADELIGMRIADLTHPDDRDRDNRQYEAFARRELPEFNIEKRCVRKDGKAIWVRVDAAIIRGPDGAPLKSVATVHDITAAKEIEARLRRSDDSHRLLVSLHDATRGQHDPSLVLQEFVTMVGRHFDVSRCLYAEVDPDGQVVTVAHDYSDGVGSLMGRHRLDEFGVSVAAELTAGRTLALDDVARDPRIAGTDLSAAYSAIVVRSVIAVPLIRNGRLVSLLAVLHSLPRAWSADDAALLEQIAERTWFAVESARAEAALRESRDVLSLAMRGARMGAWSRVIATNRVWWSRELEEIVGLAPGTFEGDEAGFLAYVHDDDKALVARAVETAIAERADYTVEFRFRHASGAWRWMEGRGQALYDAAGMPSMLYGIGIDITERKRADDELRRLNAELSDADRRKDEFIAMLAHELRNPLAPVRFAVEILRLRAAAQPEVQHARETIDRQVTQMAKLLDDLLDVARVSRGKLQMQPVPTSLASVLAMAVETSRPLIISSRHVLDVVMPPADLMIVADPARMTQVFANLLNNAARYTPAGGRLALSAAAEGGHVVVRVRDNGVGISADQLEAIFEPFAQAHGEAKSGGLGLGLALARAIVALHDGTIVGRSDGPGLGCEFVVTLPASTGDEVATGVPSDATRGTARPLEVLVVDDNRDAADSLAALLALDGHRVTAVYDGATGARTAAASPVDVVLLDIGLPDVSGYDVARQLREACAGKRLTIVAISGWGQERDKARAIEAGCDAHLTKPADPDAVRAMLEAIAASI